MHVSLKLVLVILSVYAFSIAALTQPTSLMMWSVIVLTLTLLIFGVILAFTKPRGSKTFWIWFSIALLGYLVLAAIPDRDGNIPRQTGPSPTTRLLVFSYEQLGLEPEPPAAVATKPATPPVNSNGFGGGVGGSPDPFESNKPMPDFSELISLMTELINARDEHFRRFMIIGHCVWAISLGLALGCIATATSQMILTGGSIPKQE